MGKKQNGNFFSFFFFVVGFVCSYIFGFAINFFALMPFDHHTYIHKSLGILSAYFIGAWINPILLG